MNLNAIGFTAAPEYPDIDDFPPTTGIAVILADKDFRAEGEAFLPERADPEAAKKLLAEAGYPDGKGFPKVA